jgi:hypothetical protein
MKLHSRPERAFEPTFTQSGTGDHLSRRTALGVLGALLLAGTRAAPAAEPGAAAGQPKPARGLPIRGLRIYTLPDENSRIEEYELPFPDDSSPTPIWEHADYFKMMTFPGTFTTKLHRAGTQPKLIVLLRGEAVLMGSDGSSGHLRPGMFVFAEDITGRGHTGRVISPDGAATLEIGISMPRRPFGP